MTDLDELERLAKAATPKRWKPFWGDAVEAVMCERTDKEVVFWSGFDSSRTATTKAKRQALMHFIAAANPATILSLITSAREAEGLRAASEPGAWKDRDDQWSEAIKAVHPMNSTAANKHETFMTALEMVGNRHGKYELVGLVQWLLTRALAAEDALASTGANP